MMAFAFKERSDTSTDMRLLPAFPTLQCVFPWPAPQLGQKAPARDGDAPQQAKRLPWVPGTGWHGGVTGCRADGIYGHEQLGPCKLPSHSLSPLVIFYCLCFVWMLPVLQALVEAIDWLWLLPMDGLQKGIVKINLFGPFGLTEVSNTCRTTKLVVTCQQMGGRALTDHRLWLPSCF